MIPRSSKTAESEGLALLFWESFPWSIWPLVKESWWDNNPTAQVWRMSEGWTLIVMQFWDLKARGFMQILRPGSIVRSAPLLHVLDFGVSTFLSKHILQCACSQAIQHTLVLLLWCKNQYWKPGDVFYWVKIETQLQTWKKLSWKPPLEFISHYTFLSKVSGAVWWSSLLLSSFWPNHRTWQRDSKWDTTHKEW